jgi:hypothetical protein
VYCLEEVDQELDPNLLNMRIALEAPLQDHRRGGLFAL